LLKTKKSEYSIRCKCWIKIIKSFIEKYSIPHDKILDIGCSDGTFKDMLGKYLNQSVIGIDPNKSVINSKKDIYYGYCHKIPFNDATFDLLTLISVFEHINPKLHEDSFKEMNRVLKSNALLFVQMPNPRFPIEFHTRLPLLGFLPRSVQIEYAYLSRKRPQKELSFWSIGIERVIKYAKKYNFKILELNKYIYPKEVIPKSVQKLHFILRFFPMGSYGIFQKK